MRKLTLLLLSALVFVACNPSQENNNTSHKLKIVTTTNIIGDAIKNIVKDSAEVISLMGPNIDPHAYKAVPSDLEKLQNADVIIHNGLHLEGKMSDIFKKLGRQKKMLVVADASPKSEYRMVDDGAHDPHFWFDVVMWSKGIEYIGNELVKIDTTNKKYYQSNQADYLTQLKELDLEIREMVKSIPDSQRVLITTHDAFTYFGQRYGIEMKPLKGISSVAKVGLQEATELTEFIIQKNIKAVFVETSVSSKDLESIVSACGEKGHTVSVGGHLYADALGEENSGAETYIKMVKKNVETMVNALK
ncbi:MAG: zinc ABC transporter solute-binding protein [Cytophagales bacterium]|nr:zinc ABC transporter solute-binding protein [Cytophagales bacterium]